MISSTPRSPARLRADRPALACVLLAGGLALVARGESPAGIPEPIPKSSESVGGHATDEARGTDGHSPSGAPTQTRREAFSVGLILLGGVLFCGGILLGLVIFWGHRTRRLARQPLPPVAERDELWFLKHRKEPLSESDPDAPIEPGGDDT